MKIAYIFSTLSKTGGTERMITEKANYFAEHFGYDVTIINCFQQDKDANHYYLSPKVKQINVGIPFYSQYKYGYPKRLWAKWKFNYEIKKSIIHHVQQVDPDILIGISFFVGNIISTIDCRAKKVIESHEVRTFTHSDFNHKHSFITRKYQQFWKFFYFRTIEHNADVVVSVTEGDKQLWKRAKKTYVIPNFSMMPITNYSDCMHKRIISAGRLEWEKGYKRLIEVWRIVSSKHSDWHLDIYGEGSMYDTLNDLKKKYNVRNMSFQRVTPNLSKEYATSSICAITSYYEGFSLVLLEAMKHGVPCVAFDCPYGPRSIINNEINGFLVNNGDINVFAEKMCQLIDNEDLRIRFSKNALKKANTFNVDIIMNKWKELFEQII